MTSCLLASSSSFLRQSRRPRKSDTTTTSERWRASAFVRATASPSDVGPSCSSSGSSPKRGQQPDEPDAALPRRQHARVRVSEGHDAEPVSAPRRQVADREGDPFRDVGLAAVGGPELHRDRRVDHEPADEDALRERDAHVRLVRPRGDVPVDAAHIVARHVRADERELGAFAVERRAVVAGEQSFDAPPDADVEGAQERLGHRPGAGASWAGDG